MRPDVDPLRELFRRKIEAARKAALESDGRVSSREVAQLARLARLLQLARSASPPTARRRLWMLGLVAATLVLVSTLLYARVGATEIQLDLELDDVNFVLADRQVLTDVLRLSWLGASGLRGLAVPDPTGAASFAHAADSTGIRIAAMSAGGASGEISLAPFALPPDSRLTIERTPEPFAYRLSLEGGEIALRVGVRGPIAIALVGAPEASVNYRTPRSIALRGAGEPLDVDLQLREAPASTFLPQIEIAGLSLSRVERFADAGEELVRRVSAIRSGTLHLEALNGRAVTLRAGEPLHFESVRGQIRTLELREDRMALTFRGVARGMATGWGSNRRSLMPTYLESLRERHGLYLFWGSAAYVLGVAIGILRWWGVRL